MQDRKLTPEQSHRTVQRTERLPGKGEGEAPAEPSAAGKPGSAGASPSQNLCVQNPCVRTDSEYSVPSTPHGDTKRSTAETGETPTLKRRVVQALVLAVIMFSSLGLYLTILKWRGPDGAERRTHLAWDDYFPFQPGWVWAYLLPYTFGPMLVGMLTARTFRWFVARGLVIVALTLSIFIIYPTQTAPREAANLDDGPTARLYNFMIEADDPPANAAPSLHVSLTCLLALALLRDFPRWWPVSCLGVGIVWLSTLLTRQHHLIDVATGALLACAVVVCWPHRLRSSG